MSGLRQKVAAAFTLLEVMIAVAFVGTALIALLALHHTNMQSVIRGQDLTRAAMLAQALMSQAELERFPEPGQKQGNFAQLYPGMFPNFRWRRVVDQSTLFPTVESVAISVIYGPRGRYHFEVIEFMHEPAPAGPLLPNPNQGGNGNNPGTSGATTGAGPD